MKEQEEQKHNPPFVYDRTLRELLKGLPYKFIEILSGKKGVRFIDTQLPQVKERRPDLVVELEDESVFHLEVQTKKDENIDYRMIEYYILLKRTKEIKDKRLRQMVLYLGEREEEGEGKEGKGKEEKGKKEKEEKGERKEKEEKEKEGRKESKKRVSIDDGKLLFSYDVRYINDIECRPLIESKSIEDNIIAILYYVR